MMSSNINASNREEEKELLGKQFSISSIPRSVKDTEELRYSSKTKEFTYTDDKSLGSSPQHKNKINSTRPPLLKPS